jgi:integrase
VATIEQDLAAITAAHRLANLPSPREAAVVRAVRQGIRRELGVAPAQKSRLLVEKLKAVVRELPDSLAGVRDRALLLVGFAGAFRRSKLVGIAVEDLEWVDEGLRVRLRRSKTDQEGEGATLGIPKGSRSATCPPTALRAWLETSGIINGPVFREVTRHGAVGESALSGRSVARIVKRAAVLAGLEPGGFAGHSLRAGLATSAARAKKTERDIMRQTPAPECSHGAPLHP